MSENTQSKDQNSSDEEKKPLSLKTLQLRNPVARDQVRQSFSHGKTKTVEVEVKRKRLSVGDRPTDAGSRDRGKFASTRLTNDEFGARLKAVQDAMKSSNEKAADNIENVEASSVVDDVANVSVESTPVESVVAPTVVFEAPVVDMPTTEVPKAAAPPPRPVMRQMPKKKSITAEDITPIVLRADGYGKPKTPAKKPVLEAISDTTFVDNKTPHSKAPSKPVTEKRFSDDDDSAKSSPRQDPRKVTVPVKKAVDAFPKKLNRTTIHRALDGEGSAERTRSMASLKRARQKHKGAMVSQGDVGKSVREVIIPEILTVSELANRMAVRAADVVKSLMRMGMMVTINQTIDADTAELVCSEFGHKFKRVSDSDIETGLMGADDASEMLLPRAPIVTVMGHVDHGKTSLLDALRKTDVVSTEAGGITQHIGAYQVTLSSGQKITFIDTPGHAAFSEMRSRGANITDVVILVVAADDGIMEQTIEAINHARAAGVPVVVAINKIDKPGANIDRVKADLTNHGIVLEEYGGDVMAIGVSAKTGANLDKLEEAILLQAEVLNLRANPNRRADGVIIEAKMDKGRGPVATVLVRRGTLRIGDIIVAGGEWGRVRALVNDHGKRTDEAFPATPVEIVGFNGVPSAGNELVVVDDEAKAREIAEFRRQRERDRSSVVSSKSSIEAMMSKIAAGEAKELPLVIKTDVQGSLEAILTSLTKIGTDEVCARVLHGGVGGINESDVTLAKASSGIILGFNVRANNQARDLAKRDGVDIRYYSIIYDLLDEMKALMGGLLSPTLKENYLGTAEIREVHNITKVGKVAGCYVQEGVVKRGAKVRLLRDNVVIHEGALKTLRRFKDEVRDVKESYECGIALENYSDIRPGDKIECFEIESIARRL